MEEAAVEDREVVEDDDDECSWDTQIHDRDDDAAVQAVVGTDDTRTDARATLLNFILGTEREREPLRYGAGNEERRSRNGDLRKLRPLATDCTIDSHIRN
jgi:hypothetical protein